MRRGTLVLLAGVLAGSAHAILIDDFTSGFAGATTTTAAYYNTVSANSIGGFRYVDHQFSSNPLSRPIATEVASAVPGNMFIEAGSGVNGSVTLAWGGATSSASGSGLLNSSAFSGLGSLDLTNELDFEVGYVNNDQASTQLLMFVYDGANALSSTPLQNAAIGSGTLNFSLASFSGTADLTDVKIVGIALLLPSGNDITLTRVETEAIPEPATLAVLGLAAAAIARRKRK
jgi:hypothetical protein